ncbi:LOW QUALITY PROTEIN: hypothetical protein OSB04_005688 [Centaurea solstitialis]|uniref:Uncharacterized protein n=1 Tax=Centaurea solstitialis TaxID=347529 RepID=A0AA38U169_9ASTR|nr:LOW QUALITY PROTEIN: hypothetical protein OSB04_005688 [Centaurea solstitialis]
MLQHSNSIDLYLINAMPYVMAYVFDKFTDFDIRYPRPHWAQTNPRQFWAIARLLKHAARGRSPHTSRIKGLHKFDTPRFNKKPAFNNNNMKDIFWLTRSLSRVTDQDQTETFNLVEVFLFKFEDLTYTLLLVLEFHLRIPCCIVGSLVYLTITYPDLSYVVHTVNQYGIPVYPCLIHRMSMW